VLLPPCESICNYSVVLSGASSFLSIAPIDKEMLSGRWDDD
jgi:hypothetical protein